MEKTTVYCSRERAGEGEQKPNEDGNKTESSEVISVFCPFVTFKSQSPYHVSFSPSAPRMSIPVACDWKRIQRKSRRRRDAGGKRRRRRRTGDGDDDAPKEE